MSWPVPVVLSPQYLFLQGVAFERQFLDHLNVDVLTLIASWRNYAESYTAKHSSDFDIFGDVLDGIVSLCAFCPSFLI